jgi:hypothetical protein
MARRWITHIVLMKPTFATPDDAAKHHSSIFANIAPAHNSFFRASAYATFFFSRQEIP